MKTKEEILSEFTSRECSWFAYREGVQDGYNEAFHSLRNQAAIAAMQGVMNFFGSIDYNREQIAKLAVEQADALIERLKNQDQGEQKPTERFDYEHANIQQKDFAPAEWSEEDESYLNTTIAYLKDAKEFKKTAENCINWPKSLRPQNRWKPSDEQIRALHDLNLTGNISYAGQGQVLIELYNDLKKLREE